MPTKANIGILGVFLYLINLLLKK